MGKLVAKFLVLTIIINMAMPYPSSAWAHTSEDSGPTWAKAVTRPNHDNHEKTTVLQFYFHDTVSGDSPTAVEVVPSPNSKKPFTGFGFIAMANDPLTVEPDPDSKMVGRAQGLYGSTSPDAMSLIMALTLTFNDGMYNGSSISIVGRNLISQPARELPVIGGTGLFRMVRGYAIACTYSFNLTSGNAIVGYNVTLVH